MIILLHFTCYRIICNQCRKWSKKEAGSLQQSDAAIKLPSGKESGGPRKYLLIFDLKMASFGEFWVAFYVIYAR